MQTTNIDLLKQIVGNAMRPDGFVPLKAGEVAEVRNKRAKRLADPAKPAQAALPLPKT
ncbi:hypothetical protein [Azospirillum sp. B506]|uniref:hypothetical protein n=1 Tax=Azospirillum sp. B506 TaxID=137721 RepID=UPI000347BFED|nr:hypothetical protein [Azospirillum sp. B506]